MKNKPVIGATMGDPTGIGSEIIAKAAASGVLTQDAQPIIIGAESQLKQGMNFANVNFDYQVAETIESAVQMEGVVLLDVKGMDASSVTLAKTDKICGNYTANTLKSASEYCKQGFLDGFCFGPHNKNAMHLGGFNFEGAVDLIGGFMGYNFDEVGEINVLKNFFCARVTSHIALKDVPKEMTTEKIIKGIKLGYAVVKSLGFEAPRIAVAALNPHAGDGGMYGNEEAEIIEPAIQAAREEGIIADGPYPADTMFNRLFNGDYELAVAMYHDQAQIALKTKDFSQGSIIVGGISTPVTSCAHGTAYDIVGKGIATPQPWINAYTNVVKMATAKLAA